VAAGTPDKGARNNIIDAARKVIVESGKLIEEAKTALANPGDPQNQQRLAQVMIQTLLNKFQCSFMWAPTCRTVINLHA